MMLFNRDNTSGSRVHSVAVETDVTKQEFYCNGPFEPENRVRYFQSSFPYMSGE